MAEPQEEPKNTDPELSASDDDAPLHDIVKAKSAQRGKDGSAPAAASRPTAARGGGALKFDAKKKKFKVEGTPQPTTDTMPYSKEDAMGKKVFVLFTAEDGGDFLMYRGTITAARGRQIDRAKEAAGKVFVRYPDEDEYEDFENEAVVLWDTGAVTGPGCKWPAGSSAPVQAGKVKTEKAPRRRGESEADAVATESEKTAPASEGTAAAGPAASAEPQREVSKEATPAAEGSEAADAQEGNAKKGGGRGKKGAGRGSEQKSEPRRRGRRGGTSTTDEEQATAGGAEDEEDKAGTSAAAAPAAPAVPAVPAVPVVPADEDEDVDVVGTGPPSKPVLPAAPAAPAPAPEHVGPAAPPPEGQPAVAPAEGEHGTAAPMEVEPPLKEEAPAGGQPARPAAPKRKAEASPAPEPKETAAGALGPAAAAPAKERDFPAKPGKRAKRGVSPSRPPAEKKPRGQLRRHPDAGGVADAPTVPAAAPVKKEAAGGVKAQPQGKAAQTGEHGTGPAGGVKAVGNLPKGGLAPSKPPASQPERLSNDVNRVGQKLINAIQDLKKAAADVQAVAEELAVLPTSPSELRRNKEDKLLKVVRGLSGRLVQSKEAAAKADRGFDPILEGFVDVADTVFKAGMAIRDVELHWARLPDGLQIKTQEGPVARAWRAKQASVGSFFGLEPATAAPPPAAAAPDAEPSSVKPPEDKADQHSVFATRLPDINGKPVPKTTPLAPPAGVQGKDVAPPGTDGGGDKPRLVPSTGNKTRDDVIDVLSYGLSQATTPMQAAVDIEAVLKLRYCPDVDEPNDEYLKILRRIWDAVAFESDRSNPVLRQMLMEGSLEPAELVTATPEELQTKINECLTRLGNPPKGSVKQLLVQGEVAHGTEAGPEAGKVVATGPQTITVAPVNEPEGAQQAQQAVEAAPAAVAGQAKVLSDDMEVE